jgi:hypothetical protein
MMQEIALDGNVARHICLARCPFLCFVAIVSRHVPSAAMCVCIRTYYCNRQYSAQAPTSCAYSSRDPPLTERMPASAAFQRASQRRVIYRMSDGHQYTPIRDATQDPRVCTTCGREAPKMKKCSGCRWARYCDTGCQKSHWRIHKPHCDPDWCLPTGTTGIRYIVQPLHALLADIERTGDRLAVKEYLIANQ